MSKYVLSQRSRDRLVGVHPDLIAIIERAITLTKVDFTVGEGLRSLARQKELMAQGANGGKVVTITLNSRHLSGHAVDLQAVVDGHVIWTPTYYTKIAEAMKKAASDLKIPLVWGGDWKGKAGKLGDLGHFELPSKYYPI